MRYFKQYGARRTGTNYLRALLEKNFKDITVLMHTLGDKHGIPADLQNYLHCSGGNAVDFVTNATEGVPAENTLPMTAEQLEYINEHAAAITKAVQTEQLHYLVSIKEPYAWVNSICKAGMYNSNPADAVAVSKLRTMVKEKCAGYNSSYKAYRALALRFPQQVTFVCYESLLESPFVFLHDLQDKLALHPVFDTYADIENTAFPTSWDQNKSTRALSGKKFDREFYRQRKYLAAMHPEVLAVLETEIDWALMSWFGYEKTN